MTRPVPSLLALLLALSGCPESGQTEIARGNLLASQRKLDPAADAYRAASRALPKKARPLELLGHVRFDQQRWAESRAAYQQALETEPDLAVEAEIGLARLDAEQDKIEAALERLTRVLAAHPENLYARLSRANLLVRRGGEADLRLALEDTAAASSLAPQSIAVLYTRGCAFIAARELEQARAVFAQLGRVSPASCLAPYGLARVAGAASDRTEVIHNLRQARTRAKASPGAWRPDEVRADPAFRFMKDDPDFLKELSEPER